MAAHAAVVGVGGGGGCGGCATVVGGAGEEGGGIGVAVVAVSLADLSTWCFACDDYVTDGGGTGGGGGSGAGGGVAAALDALHMAKFGGPRGGEVVDLRAAGVGAAEVLRNLVLEVCDGNGSGGGVELQPPLGGDGPGERGGEDAATGGPGNGLGGDAPRGSA